MWLVYTVMTLLICGFLAIFFTAVYLLCEDMVEMHDAAKAERAKQRRLAEQTQQRIRIGQS